MFFPKQKHPLRVLLKSDETMFLPQAKAMHLRRDVCLWHVADKKCYCEWKQGYPASTQYPAGTPITPRNDIECFARVIKVFPKIKAPFWVLLITRRKRREFDVFKPHKYTVSCGDPDYARTEIKKILTPKGENYIIYSVKSQNFDEILMFLGKFLRGRVLRRT